MIRKVCIYLFFSILIASDFIPEEDSILNYTQVFFKWPQMEDVDYYVLEIVDSLNESYLVQSQNNSIIVQDFIDWNNEYIWNVCGINSLEETSFCYQAIMLSINSLPDYYPNGNQLQLLNDGVYDGITLLDFDGLGFSVALDQASNPIWFADKNNFNPSKILVTQILDSGNFIGFGGGNGYEFDINSEILFETPSEYGVHHHFIKSDSTYFFLDTIIEQHPCPNNCPDNLPNSINWQGDHFFEIDSDGELIWEWNTFDYIDLVDYNPFYLDRLSLNYQDGDEMDWTHSNSIFYDNGNIFISVRNLSRILKIDYNTKDLIWHLGDEDFMNQIYFNNNIEFSQQHSVQVLDNGNILFFDNHTFLEPEISRCIEFNYDEIVDSINVVWEYILPDSLFSGSRGECDRLENGNTLINVGRTGNLIEVDSTNQIVWHYKMMNNNSPVPSYRAERINSLYPLAFSFEVMDLKGSYIENYFIESIDTLHGYINNKGWANQLYEYHLLDDSESNIFSNNILIPGNSVSQFHIPLNELSIIENQQYTIRIIPVSNSNKFQDLKFNFENLFLGDLNQDSIVNVLDAILLVNLILDSSYLANGDINSDNILDILDLILTINIILG